MEGGIKGSRKGGKTERGEDGVNMYNSIMLFINVLVQ